eukprot:134210-Chlamydomonas_euryale.AAC.1
MSTQQRRQSECACSHHATLHSRASSLTVAAKAAAAEAAAAVARHAHLHVRDGRDVSGLKDATSISRLFRVFYK